MLELQKSEAPALETLLGERAVLGTGLRLLLEKSSLEEVNR